MWPLITLTRWHHPMFLPLTCRSESGACPPPAAPCTGTRTRSSPRPRWRRGTRPRWGCASPRCSGDIPSSWQWLRYLARSRGTPRHSQFRAWHIDLSFRNLISFKVRRHGPFLIIREYVWSLSCLTCAGPTWPTCPWSPASPWHREYQHKCTWTPPPLPPCVLCWFWWGS